MVDRVFELPYPSEGLGPIGGSRDNRNLRCVRKNRGEPLAVEPNVGGHHHRDLARYPSSPRGTYSSRSNEADGRTWSPCADRTVSSFVVESHSTHSVTSPPEWWVARGGCWSRFATSPTFSTEFVGSVPPQRRRTERTPWTDAQLDETIRSLRPARCDDRMSAGAKNLTAPSAGLRIGVSTAGSSRSRESCSRGSCGIARKGASDDAVRPASHMRRDPSFLVALDSRHQAVGCSTLARCGLRV